jgi:hypothetical protein
MGFHKSNGEFADVDNLSVEAGVTRTATGSSNAIDVGERSSACLELNVTAASGTSPTMTVAIETSKDGSGTGLGAWRSVASFAAATGVTSERKSFAGLDRYVRATATIGGTTPSFTYSVSGDLKG